MSLIKSIDSFSMFVLAPEGVKVRWQNDKVSLVEGRRVCLKPVWGIMRILYFGNELRFWLALQPNTMNNIFKVLTYESSSWYTCPFVCISECCFRWQIADVQDAPGVVQCMHVKFHLSKSYAQITHWQLKFWSWKSKKKKKMVSIFCWIRRHTCFRNKLYKFGMLCNMLQINLALRNGINLFGFTHKQEFKWIFSRVFLAYVFFVAEMEGKEFVCSLCTDLLLCLLLCWYDPLSEKASCETFSVLEAWTWWHWLAT